MRPLRDGLGPAGARRQRAARISATAAAGGVGHTFTDREEAFLDTLQHRTFRWFWERTNHETGLTPDRWPTESFSSIAAIGFGLTGYGVGAERGYVPRAEAAERTLNTLRTLYTLPQGPGQVGTAGHRGYFYHFLEYDDGTRFRNTELSTIDTALLMAGVLFSREYFDRAAPEEAAIRAYADSLYQRVEWDFFDRPGADDPRLMMGWYPESDFGRAYWEGYNEGMILYLLGLGSPTHPLDASVWPAWTGTYEWQDFYGYEHVNFSPLFGHQYSHMFVDFRGIQDDWMRSKSAETGGPYDYFENSRRATLSQRAYATDNPNGWTGYGADVWGLTASDGPSDGRAVVSGEERQFHTYWARGASADHVNDDGTLAPTALGGSVPFAPAETVRAMMAMAERFPALWTDDYGFRDAVNPSLTADVAAGLQIKQNSEITPQGWVDHDYLGIDQGPILVMVENARTGLVWETLKKSPYLVRGLQRAGFRGGWLDGARTRAVAPLDFPPGTAASGTEGRRLVVVLGSSTAEGFGPSDADSTWVNRLRVALAAADPSLDVLNLAKGGYTTYHVLPAGSDGAGGTGRRARPPPQHRRRAGARPRRRPNRADVERLGLRVPRRRPDRQLRDGRPTGGGRRRPALRHHDGPAHVGRRRHPAPARRPRLDPGSLRRPGRRRLGRRGPRRRDARPAVRLGRRRPPERRRPPPDLPARAGDRPAPESDGLERTSRHPPPTSILRPLLLLLALAPLAACGGEADGVVLEFWAMGAEGENVRPLLDRFEAENPGVRVEVQRLPWTSAHEKLLTSFAGRSTPDAAQLGNTWVAEFEALGALADLTDRVRRSDAVEPDDYFAGAWDANVIGGRVWGVPWYVDTRLLFYRSDLFAEAGYPTMPATWAEWETAMRRVQAVQPPGGYPILLPVNEFEPPLVLALNTSDLLRDGDRYGNFRSPEFRRAFAFYVGLYRDGLAPATSGTEVSNLYQEFASGRFASYITGPWNIGEFRRRLPDDRQSDWATAPIPGPEPGTPGVSVAGGSSLVVFERSGHPDQAWALVEFLSRPDVQVEFNRLTGNLPPMESVWEATGLADDEHARAFRDQLRHVRPTPKVPEQERVAQTLREYAEFAARGEMTVDQALARMDADVDRILEKRRWLLDREVTE